MEGQVLPVRFKIYLAESAGFITLIDLPCFDIVQNVSSQHRNLGKASFIGSGLLQNSTDEKNEIDFPKRGCLSHFLL